MPWVWVNGHRYYRRSRRVGAGVLTEHLGRGRVAGLTDRLDDEERTLRRLQMAEARLDRDAILGGVRDVLAVDDVLGTLFAVLSGQCRVYRCGREWGRGADVLASLKGMAGDIRKVLAELDRSRTNPPLMRRGSIVYRTRTG